MGNTESNVTSGVKKQADTSSVEVYKYADLKGGGILVELTKKAQTNKNASAELEQKIKELVTPFLYNGGEGKLVPIQEIVLERNKDRPSNKRLNPPKTDWAAVNGKPEIDNSMPEAAYHKNVKYRRVCWRMDKLGAVGENILHLCLLNATSVHSDLAKRLIRTFPKLINDIYFSDEYYGESVLHMAIVNEDPAMVKFLLDHGINYHERCNGNFMTPEDQKASRTDSLDEEWVSLCVQTNFEGYVYWGEYPLSFAACLNQEECYRLMLARGADPNLQDLNGNTVLHLLCIYEKEEMFDVAYELGADLNGIYNRQHLTPLTLAACLARKDMFFHILKLEREIYWQIGSITCAAYPLKHIDTIDGTTGLINTKSALNLIVYGEKEGHIEMMEGVIVDLLKVKWNSFVKLRFFRQFALFGVYFLFSLVAFVLRPGPMEPNVSRTIPTGSSNSSLVHVPEKPPMSSVGTQTLITAPSDNAFNDTEKVLGQLNISSPTARRRPSASLRSRRKGKDYDHDHHHNEHGHHKQGVGHSDNEEKRRFRKDQCYLLEMKAPDQVARWMAEIVMVISSVLYLIGAGREMKFLGTRMFLENLATVPTRVLFLCSCFLVVLMVPLRLSCASKTEDHLAVLVMLTTGPYFLFFCRGFKTVGPFVVMIYKMIMGDLLRFGTIYSVFIMGFAQSYYILFLTYKQVEVPEDDEDGIYPCTGENPIPNIMEAILTMFVMSLNKYDMMYAAFECTNHNLLCKSLFVMFMIIVTVLLVNMLIAMMGNTYQKIAETKNEWQRQWARIVLVVERGVSPAERLNNQKLYSNLMSDGRRALILRHRHTDEDKEELKDLQELRITHKKSIARRLKGSNPLSSGSHSPKTHRIQRPLTPPGGWPEGHGPYGKHPHGHHQQHHAHQSTATITQPNNPGPASPSASTANNVPSPNSSNTL
ncbi:unnamed protein product [Cyprideis torosa]|uniref:Ion transport domain-containing protein n=1 Tax=Cyprideis torosa TaxID=163714 RepID=A0A7R8ZPU1_9CRUS|nr:unnamed protein product [Cyprideis torosa]CAG0889066.1 unnamed protein product [Cyprideis torosa]